MNESAADKEVSVFSTAHCRKPLHRAGRASCGPLDEPDILEGQLHNLLLLEHAEPPPQGLDVKGRPPGPANLLTCSSRLGSYWSVITII